MLTAKLTCVILIRQLIFYYFTTNGADHDDPNVPYISVSKLNLIQSSLCEKYDGIVGNQASYASNLFESMTSNRIDGQNQTGWILTENVSPE